VLLEAVQVATRVVGHDDDERVKLVSSSASTTVTSEFGAAEREAERVRQQHGALRSRSASRHRLLLREPR